jgi:hypothetical protein
MKVRMMRSCKQVLADKMAHPVGSKSKLKALAEAKLRKAKVWPLPWCLLRAAAACVGCPACASSARACKPYVNLPTTCTQDNSKKI